MLSGLASVNCLPGYFIYCAELTLLSRNGNPLSFPRGETLIEPTQQCVHISYQSFFIWSCPCLNQIIIKHRENKRKETCSYEPLIGRLILAPREVNRLHFALWGLKQEMQITSRGFLNQDKVFSYALLSLAMNHKRTSRVLKGHLITFHFYLILSLFLPFQFLCHIYSL